MYGIFAPLYLREACCGGVWRWQREVKCTKWTTRRAGACAGQLTSLHVAGLDQRPDLPCLPEVRRLWDPNPSTVLRITFTPCWLTLRLLRRQNLTNDLPV